MHIYAFVEATTDKFLGAGLDLKDLPQRPNIEHLYRLNILGWILKYVNDVNSNQMNDCPKFKAMSKKMGISAYIYASLAYLLQTMAVEKNISLLI